MLARVAEALNWMARYIERAEDLTRMLAVNFNTLLDAGAADSSAAWEPVITMNGDAALFHEIYGPASAAAVISPTLCPATTPGEASRAAAESRPAATSSGWATAVSRISSASAFVP